MIAVSPFTSDGPTPFGQTPQAVQEAREEMGQCKRTPMRRQAIAAGNRVASTATIFPVIVAGGRAIDALRSITVAQHLFGIQNVVVVHHSYCGVTTFTTEGIVETYKHEHGSDISRIYEQGSICIEDYEASLKRDAALIRSHAGTPRQANIFGYFYNIDTGQLTEVVKDKANADAARNADLWSPDAGSPLPAQLLS